MADKEYIEREATLEIVRRTSGDYAAAFSEIGRLPTADVVEVRHGEWQIKSEIHQMFDDVDEEIYVECPFCQRTFWVPYEFENEKIFEYAREHYPYCNCGAKMKGGAE